MRKTLVLLGLLALNAGAFTLDGPDQTAPLPDWFQQRAPRLSQSLRRPPAPPTSGEDEAEALLLKAPRLEDRWLDANRRPSPLWAAFNTLANGRRAPERLEKLFRRAETPAGQLYALRGLVSLAPERFCALRSQVKADSPVELVSGDAGLSLRAGDLVGAWAEALDCDQTQRRAVANAVGRLIRAQRLEDEFIGFAAQPSELWAALHFLQQEKDAAALLERVFNRARTPAGQLYALQGLAQVAPARFCALRDRVDARQPVNHLTADLFTTPTAGDLITLYGEGLDCARLQP